MNPRSAPPPPPRGPSPLAGARLARVPASALAALAGLRGRLDVRVTIDGEIAWVAWEPEGRSGRDEVVEALLPVPGAAFYRGGEGGWYRVGRRLPEFAGGPPEGAEAGGVPLHRAVVPGPVHWEEPGRGWAPVGLRLVRDDRPRRASALIAAAVELLGWAEHAPTARLAALRASRSGDRVLVIGRRLPPIAGEGRYWGDRVLVPLGYRPEPALPEAVLAGAIGLEEDGSLGLVGPDGSAEVVPAGALAALSRASARRMAGVSDRMPGGGEGP